MSNQLPELGPLEMKVMGLLEQISPQSVTQVQSTLSKQHEELAYTTVMTILSRLHQKGLLTREKEGRYFLYAPCEKAGKFSGKVFDKFRDTFFGGEKLHPILSLIDGDEQLSREDLLELKKIVDAKLKNPRGKV